MLSTQLPFPFFRESSQRWSAQPAWQRPEMGLSSESPLRKLIDHVVFIYLERNSLWKCSEVCLSPFLAATQSANKINWCNLTLYTSVFIVCQELKLVAMPLTSVILFYKGWLTHSFQNSFLPFAHGNNLLSVYWTRYLLITAEHRHYEGERRNTEFWPAWLLLLNTQYYRGKKKGIAACNDQRLTRSSL